MWAEEEISELVEKAHKNMEMFRERILKNGLNQSVEQCCVKDT